jgi:ribosomal protein S18 acetylase RimI-like enzyme
MDSAERELARRLEESVSQSAPDGDTEALSIGPFRAFFDPHTAEPELNTVMPVAPLGAEDELGRAIEEVRRQFAARQRTPRFEFFASRWPELPAALERAGLESVGAEPLMYCGPDDLRPVSAPGVSLRVLDASATDADLVSYITIRDEDSTPPPAERVARLRGRLRDGHDRFVLAVLDGVPAGTGRLVLLGDGLAELVAIVTAEPMRRRGVAATVVTKLVADHFASGGTLAFLNAADARAQSVYRREGFRDLDTLLNYMYPA